jgi:hypothetical protein
MTCGYSCQPSLMAHMFTHRVHLHISRHMIKRTINRPIKQTINCLPKQTINHACSNKHSSYSHVKPSAPVLPNIQATPSNAPSSFPANSHMLIHPNHVHDAQPYVQPQYAHPQPYGQIPTYYPHNPQQYPPTICAMDPYGHPIMIPNPRLLGQHIPHMQTAQVQTTNICSNTHSGCMHHLTS